MTERLPNELAGDEPGAVGATGPVESPAGEAGPPSGGPPPGGGEGVPVGVAAEPEAPPVRPRVVGEDHPCLSCGYSLRGLPEDGRCPECGAEVSRSLRGVLLENSSADYVGSLHRGMVFVETAVVLYVILLAASFAVALAGAWQGAGVGLLANGVGFVVALVSLTGWWLVSTPDPVTTQLGLGRGSRRVLRFALVVRLIGTIVGMIHGMFVLVILGAALATLLAVIAGAIGFAGTVAAIVQFFASLVYLQTVARRIPDEDLARSARRMMLWGPALVTFGFIVGVIGLALMMAGGGAVAFFVLIPLAAAGPLIAFFLYLRLVDRFRVSLRGIAEQLRAEAGHAPA